MAIASELLLAAHPSAADGESVDYTELITRAYALGDMIKQSDLVDKYLYWKQQVASDEEVKRISARLSQAKEKYAECERFGRFHPDYHEALNQMYAVQEELNQIAAVQHFKAAERELDELLHEIACMIARSVSESVKVPDLDPNARSGGCGSGGRCSCGSGGCG